MTWHSSTSWRDVQRALMALAAGVPLGLMPDRRPLRDEQKYVYVS